MGPTPSSFFGGLGGLFRKTYVDEEKQANLVENMQLFYPSLMVVKQKI